MHAPAARLLSILVALAAGIAAVALPARDAGAQPVALTEWQATAPFNNPRASHAAVLVGNRLYVLGGYSYGAGGVNYYNDVQTALLGNDGGITGGGWQATAPFAVPRTGLGSISYDGRLHIVGGYGSSRVLGDVQIAPINPDGTLGPWSPSPQRLNIPRSNLSLQVVAAPSGGGVFLMAVAGVADVAPNTTVHFDEIEVAPINGDGTIGQWRVCPYHLKGGWSAPATLVLNERLYVFGGWGDLDADVFRDVQWAPLRTDGCPDAWHGNPFPLEMPIYGHTVGIATAKGGVPAAVILGGNAGSGTYLNAVQIATLRVDGDTNAWIFDQHQFATPRWGQATVVYGGYIYVIGGAQRGGSGFLNDVQFTKATPPP